MKQCSAKTRGADEFALLSVKNVIQNGLRQNCSKIYIFFEVRDIKINIIMVIKKRKVDARFVRIQDRQMKIKTRAYHIMIATESIIKKIILAHWTRDLEIKKHVLVPEGIFLTETQTKISAQKERFFSNFLRD